MNTTHTTRTQHTDIGERTHRAVTPPAPWLATFVTRWHSGPSAPWLAHTQDRIGGHSGRMGVLALHFWPDCSRDLLVACLCHDLGECIAGDVPAPAKRDGTMRGALDRIEAAALADMGMAYSLHPDDEARLKFLDRLDAFLWAQHHAHQIMNRNDWWQGCQDVCTMANDLGVKP